MRDTERGERLHVMLAARELVALDTWRFKARMPSRAAAVRELLRLGLASEGCLEAGYGLRSRDFGVTTSKQAFGQTDDRPSRPRHS